jgi:hypothetical protein
MINRFPDLDTYFTEINHVLLASRGYEYDGFLDFLNSIVFISLNDNLWIFLYNFLFVVYFYSNKIWCIEKLILQYTIKPIDFTGMSTSQSTTHTSPLIVFKMDDDGSALRVGKRSSLLRCFGQFFRYVICFYENLFTVNYFWQNKLCRTPLAFPYSYTR